MEKVRCPTLKKNGNLNSKTTLHLIFIDELEFWELTENGGSQWKVEEMPGDCGYNFCNSEVTKYFATSFEWVFPYKKHMELQR